MGQLNILRQGQVGLDAWITKIQDYLKDNILPDEHVPA
jgi:hypothetical protein